MPGRSQSLVLLLALAGCGGPESSFDVALAAFRAGELRLAEARARESDAPEATFLRGNIAYAQSEVAEEQAATMGAEPFAWDIALNYIESALGHWKRAAMTPSTRPRPLRAVSSRSRAARTPAFPGNSVSR